MKQKKRRNHVLSLIVIFILVALVFGAAWGVVTILDRLSYYGESTTIQTDPIEPIDEQETPVPDEEEEEMLAELEQGMKIGDIANKHCRTTGAIRSRIKKIRER